MLERISTVADRAYTFVTLMNFHAQNREKKKQKFRQFRSEFFFFAVFMTVCQIVRGWQLLN